jgi:hypothetical protein
MQKLIGVLLGFIAVLLGVIIFLLVRPSVEGEGAGNTVQSEEAAPEKAPPVGADDSGVNPIDAIVENVISNDGDLVGPPAVKISTIPKQFWGRWTLKPELCGQDDDSAIDIAPKRIQFWESAGDVQSVTITNPMTIEVAASYSGEGQTWDATANYALSGSRRELMVSSKDSKGQWYKRCPDSPAAP